MLFVSLGFGLVAAIGISQVMGRNKGNGEPSVPKVPVVVARTMLNHESKFDQKTVEIAEWPVNIVPEGAISSLKELENMVIATPVTKGMPINKSNLVESSKVVNVPIPAGKKVMGIPLDAEDHLDGLMRPGDKVDIVGVFRNTVNNQEVSSSRTFLKNIKIFSVGDSFKRDLTMEKSGGSGKINVGVLVNEKESEILTLALGLNTKLKVLMRPDTGTDETEIVDDPFVKNLLDRSRAAEELLMNGESGPKKSTLTDMLSKALSNTKTTQMVIWQGSDPEITRFDARGQRIQPAPGPAFGSAAPGSPTPYPQVYPGAVPGAAPGTWPGAPTPPAPVGPEADSAGSAGNGSPDGSDKGFEEDQYSAK